MTEPKAYRASDYVRGSMTEFVYGKDVASLHRRAKKLLMCWKPGQAGLWPLRYDIEERTHVIDRRRSGWHVIESVHYEDLI